MDRYDDQAISGSNIAQCVIAPKAFKWHESAFEKIDAELIFGPAAHGEIIAGYILATLGRERMPFSDAQQLSSSI